MHAISVRISTVLGQFGPVEAAVNIEMKDRAAFMSFGIKAKGIPDARNGADVLRIVWIWFDLYA